MHESYSLPGNSKERPNYRGQFLSLARKALVYSLIASAPLTGFAQKRHSSDRAGRNTSAGQTQKTNKPETKTLRIVTEKEIYDMLWTDTFERTFVGGSEGLHEVAGGNKESAIFYFEAIRAQIKKSTGPVIVAHDHPVSTYIDPSFEYSYSVSEIESMRENRTAPPSMPPSSTDIVGSVSLYEEFKDEKVDIRQRVYDTTGVWEYTVDTNHPAVVVFKRISAGLKARMFENLTQADIKMMKDLDLAKVHPLRVIEVLKQNPVSSELGERLEENIQDFVENLSKEDYKVLKKFSEVERSGALIPFSRKMGKTPEETKDLVDAYLQAVSEVGVNMRFTPRDEIKKERE